MNVILPPVQAPKSYLGGSGGSYSARKSEANSEKYQDIARERASRKRHEDDKKYKDYLEKEERAKQAVKEEMQRKVKGYPYRDYLDRTIFSAFILFVIFS